MARNVSQKLIFDSIIRGFEEAQEKYEKMAGGWWLGHAPEYFLTSKVAETIAEDTDLFVTLEHGISDIVCEAGIQCKGPMPKKMRNNGRADILIWWASDYPRAIVEVKNNVFSINKLKCDIDRIDKLLKKNGTSGKLQFGCLAFHTCAASNSRNKKATEILSQRIKIFYENLKNRFDGTYRISKHSTDLSKFSKLDEAWVGVCFGFHPLRCKEETLMD
jgi:hypothetical protein